MPQERKVSSTNSGGGVAFGVVSLTAGILSILAGVYFYIGIPLAAVAIVFGALGLKKPDSRTLAIIGLITGIIGAVYGVYYLVVWAMYVSSIQHMPRFYRYY